MSERSEFLDGLEAIALQRGVVWYRCGELAALAGITPLDVLDKTEELACSWDHCDFQHFFIDFQEVRGWAMASSEVPNIDIAFPKDGHAERLADALGILPEGEE